MNPSSNFGVESFGGIILYRISPFLAKPSFSRATFSTPRLCSGRSAPKAGLQIWTKAQNRSAVIDEKPEYEGGIDPSTSLPSASLRVYDRVFEPVQESGQKLKVSGVLLFPLNPFIRYFAGGGGEGENFGFVRQPEMRFQKRRL